MALGTFWDIFGFPIGKKISKIILLVDFSRQSKWQNQIFPKKHFLSKIFFGPPKESLPKKKLAWGTKEIF